MDEDTEAALMRAGAQIVALQHECADANKSMVSALRLVADLRWALGDSGKLMQLELLEHAASLCKDAERWRCLRDSLPGNGGPPCSHTLMPAVTDPFNPTLTYTREGLVDTVDRVIESRHSASA
jgi:hypothetical protein